MSNLLRQILGWPLFVIGLLASVAAVGLDPRHAWAAGVALVLVLPPAVVVVWLVQRWRGSPLGCVAVVMLASFLRLLVGFGGGLGVFLLFRRLMEWDPLIFWGWLLGTYLMTLAIETVVLARYVTQTPRAGSEQSVPVVAPEVARPGH